MLSRRELFSGALSSPLLLSRTEAQVTSGMMRYRPEIEPLVVLIEQAPRDKAAELVVAELRRGVPYRQIMAALFLAGIRNVNPRPPGFALHCVFVIHSAHLLSLEAPPDGRLLPLSYALQNFKTAQERDARQAAGDYAMRSIHGKLPDAGAAAREFEASMDAWDIDRAERAVVSLARTHSPAAVTGMLQRYGARDYRNIGHKAIYVANACRTLNVIGWQYAEPVLRSLVVSLLDFGKEQQVNGYKLDDQCYSGNLRRVKETFPRLEPAWTSAQSDAGAARAMLSSWRTSSPDEACSDAAVRLTKGAGAGAIWDAVHLAAAELAMRTRKSAIIVGIHAVTSVNALHHAYTASSAPETRLLLLLQAVGWMTQFRTWAQAREQGLRDVSITALEPSAEDGKLEEIFAGIPGEVDASAARVLRLSRDVRARQEFLTAALRLLLSKADEVHYYKYLAALIEDIPLVSPEWQPHLAATVVYYAKGSADAESAPMKKAREALRGLSA